MAKRKLAKGVEKEPAQPSKRPKVAPSMLMVNYGNSDRARQIVVLGDTDEVRKYLDDHEEEMRREYKKVAAILKRWWKELSSGKYGEVTGALVELESKRGFVIMPPRYGITVCVTRKPPTDPGPGSYGNAITIRKKGESQVGVLQIPKLFKEIPIHVVEANASFASNVLTGEFADDDDPPPPAAPVSISGGLAFSEDNRKPWGTLGLSFKTKDGVMRFVSCRHVVKSGDVVQPPFGAIANGAPHRTVGIVTSAKSAPARGVDVSIGNINFPSVEGVVDINEPLKYLVSPLSPSQSWSWFERRNVVVRGAKTGVVCHGVILSTIERAKIGGVLFQDLIRIHADPSSATLVQRGDSGEIVILKLGNGQHVWIGITIALHSPQVLLATKLPSAMSAIGLTTSDFAAEQLWSPP